MTKRKRIADAPGLFELLEKQKRHHDLEEANREAAWWRKGFYFQNQTDWDNPFWIVKRRFNGPKLEAALELYDRESTFYVDQIRAGLGIKYPLNLSEEDRELIQRMEQSPDFFLTPECHRKAIRTYYEGIDEAWKKLPKKWQLPRGASLDCYRTGLKDYTGKSICDGFRPGHYFRKLLDMFTRQVTPHMHSKYDEYLSKQRTAAQHGADARWGDRKELNAAIEGLAKRRDELGEFTPAKELWPEFFSILDNAGMRPDEQGDRITWNDQPKGITLATFTSRISRLRNT